MLDDCLAGYPGAALELRDGLVYASNGGLEAQLGRAVVGEPFESLLEDASRAKWRDYLDAAIGRRRPTTPARLPVELTLVAGDRAHLRSFVVAPAPDDAGGRCWIFEHRRDPEAERLLEHLADANSALATMHRELERERARLADALARAEAAVHTRDDVLAVVAHDLRNPLAGITMTVDLLLNYELPPERRRLRLQSIRDAALRVERLTRDLLEVALIEAGHVVIGAQPTSAAAIVREAAAAFDLRAHERGISLVSEPGEGELLALADPARIQRVLANLLDNALRHTPSGGLVTVRARPEGEDAVRFDVTNTGPGIPADELPHLFRRFWQSRRDSRSGSAGLGLGIAKGLVEAHGGRIWVQDDHPGAETVFSFTLPRCG